MRVTRTFATLLSILALSTACWAQAAASPAAAATSAPAASKPKAESDVSMRALMPAFMVSELKTAFQIGFLIYIPFLVIDMVVASALMSMGMMMLPPTMVSLPFKILLFVMIDGWHLIAKSVVLSFG